MKNKYACGETVRIKATGEKVKIVKYGGLRIGEPSWYVEHKNKKVLVWWESSLKPYRPSRTGKYRDSKGRFMSKIGGGAGGEIAYKFSDSKQRNYQKIDHIYVGDMSEDYRVKQEMLDKINELVDHINDLEKKIDELGRKI